MKSTITITPVENIENNAVIDNDLITQETYDTHKDTLIFKNMINNKIRVDFLITVSIFDDVILKTGAKAYKILQMLSK